MSLQTLGRNDGTGNFAQASLGTVARHSVANFFGTGVADPYPTYFALGAVQHLENETRHCDPLAPRGTLEITALG